MKRLLWRNIVTGDAKLHVARLTLREGAGFGAHTHDFAEVFWIERGEAVHEINRRREPLTAGQMVLMRPADTHDFLVRARCGATLVNVAFEADVLEQLRSRYFAQSSWPWAGERLPAKFKLTPADLVQLRGWADDLARAAPGARTRDWFLLSVLHLISRAPLTHADPNRPAWLDDALTRFANPDEFPGGVARLAELAQRCPEHLNRVVRKVSGKTATDLVNELRLDFASRELRMTNRPILDITLDCGLENLGYFYRIFKKRFGLTPRQFRLQKDAVVG